MLLLDVTPLTLGIETKGRRDDEADRAQHDHPGRSKSEVFSTAEDNQPSVEIHVPGRARDGEQQQEPRQVPADGIPPAPRGIPQIEVTFDIDANGIINADREGSSAPARAEDRDQSPGSGPSDDEINSMVSDAERMPTRTRSSASWPKLRTSARTPPIPGETADRARRQIDGAPKTEIEDKIRGPAGIV